MRALVVEAQQLEPTGGAGGAAHRASCGEQAMSEATNHRLLQLPEMKEKVWLSRTAIDRLIAEDQFPK